MTGEAYEMARVAHSGQMYGKGPYILHPVGVSEMVRPFGEVYAVVGMLHDVVEDSTFAVRDVREEFGSAVARAVHLLTHPVGWTYDNYIDRLVQAEDGNMARAVKLADIAYHLSYGGIKPSLARRYGRAVEKLVSKVTMDKAEHLGFL